MIYSTEEDTHRKTVRHVAKLTAVVALTMLLIGTLNRTPYIDNINDMAEPYLVINIDGEEYYDIMAPEIHMD